ncbi:MAG: hypothetical protein HGN29_00550 [Asgard group archaeon]|nr:hypothetical protein [Asgard group archaeon]
MLSYFKEKHPNDNRLRKAVEAARAGVKGEIKVGVARSAAFESHIATRETDDEVAYAIALAAGHTASISHVPSHAIHAANYAAKVNTKERVWQYEKLLELQDNIKKSSN